MFGLIVGLSKNIGRNNMKRKKILALLMVAALCVGTVAGCGSKDTESSKSESGKNENSESSTGDSEDDLSPITLSTTMQTEKMVTGKILLLRRLLKPQV